MELEIEVKKLVAHIKSCGLQIPARTPPHEHVGSIIADAVLQVGHRWKTHVGPRLERMRDKYPNADTISGVSALLDTKGAQELLKWKGKDAQERFSQSIHFFENEHVETFNQLREWLEKDNNRDRLVIKIPGNDKAGIPKIENATADYYRVLAGLTDAVKVDSLVQKFLADAGIEVKKYAYEEKRSIVQLAAKQLGKRPIDLDSAIWNYEEKKNRGGNNMATGKLPNVDELYDLCDKAGLKTQADLVEAIVMSDLEKLPNIPSAWKRATGLHQGKIKSEILTRIKKAKFIELLPGKNHISGIDSAYYIRCKKAGEKYDALIAQLKSQMAQTYTQTSTLSPQSGPVVSAPKSPVHSSPITISLPIVQSDKLKKFADECGTDMPTLVQIWLLERLHKLN
jgi:hypothetical protein